MSQNSNNQQKEEIPELKTWSAFTGALNNSASKQKINYMFMQSINLTCQNNRQYPMNFGSAISNVLFGNCGLTPLSTKHCVDVRSQVFYEHCPGISTDTKSSTKSSSEPTDTKSSTKSSSEPTDTKSSTKDDYHYKNHKAVYDNQNKIWVSAGGYRNLKDVIKYSYKDEKIKTAAWNYLVTKYKDTFIDVLKRNKLKKENDSDEIIANRKKLEHLSIKRIWTLFGEENKNCTPIKKFSITYIILL